MKVEKVTLKTNTKYVGFQDDQGHWHECTMTVRNYVEKFMPCDLEIEFTNAAGIVEKVNIYKNENQQLTPVETDVIKRLEEAVKIVVECAGQLKKDNTLQR